MSVNNNRQKNIEIIQSNIRLVNDTNMNKIFQKVSDSLAPCADELNKITTRAKKIQYVEKNLDLVDDQALNDAGVVITMLSETEDEKLRRVGLEICNRLLVAINKPQIDDFCDFKRISRQELMSDQCKQIIAENVNYAFESGFKKKDFTQYIRESKSSHVAFLRALLKIIGYDLYGKNGSMTDENGKRTRVFYYIKLIE